MYTKPLCEMTEAERAAQREKTRQATLERWAAEDAADPKRAARLRRQAERAVAKSLARIAAAEGK